MFMEGEFLSAKECPKRLSAMLSPCITSLIESKSLGGKETITTLVEEELHVARARNLPFVSIRDQAASPISPK
jgi:hypothetical protein